MLMEIRTGQPDDFRGVIEARDLGAANVVSVLSGECTCVRTSRMVRQDDPELLQLVVPLNSRTTVHQNRGEAVIGSSELAIYTTSRPYVIHSTADSQLVRGLMVLLPRALLPVPIRKVEKLVPAVFPGGSGIGALLSSYLTGVATDSGNHAPADAVRLGAVLVDLLGALVASRVEEKRFVPPESRHRMTLLQVHAFIEKHLDDPELTPASVAAAHHMSLRALHRLFKDQDLPVAAWIRHRRLERCRRDLIDPDLRGRSIQAIASRYGFTNAPHFSRVFRAAYGTTPLEYRGLTGPRVAADRLASAAFT